MDDLKQLAETIANELAHVLRNFIAEVGHTIGPIAETLTKVERFMRFLSERGWGIPAYSTDMATYAKALADCDWDFAAAEGVIASYYHDMVSPYAGVIADQPALKPWAEMIRDSAIAHNEGRFGTAIPIWLIAIEATTNALKNRSTHPLASGYRAFTNRSVTKYIGSFESLFDAKSAHVLRKYLARTLSAMGQDGKLAAKFAPTINRNIVFHGLKAIDSRDDSLRAMSVLFALVDEAIHDENSTQSPS
jgi:hypothetical protein